jgi:hypothetical protein
MGETNLSDGAKRLLERMRQAEGHWLSASEGRANRDAMNELQDKVLATHGEHHGRDGFKLTRSGENYEISQDKKPRKKRSTK